MARKLCPICDKPLDGGCYCSECKKIIRHPVILKSDVYLNERHSRNEKDCDFHGEYAKVNDTVDSRTGDGHNAESTAGRHTDLRTRKAAGKGVSIVMVPVIMMVLLVMQFGTKFSSSSISIPIGGTPEPVEYSDSASEEEFKEFTDEEAGAMGTHCNTKGHFALLGENVGSVMLETFLSFGYEREDAWESSYNYATGDDDKTWYSFTNVYSQNFLPPASQNLEGSLYLSIDSDTVTDEVHSISATAVSKEDAIELLKELVGIVEASYGTDEAITASRIDTVCNGFEDEIDTSDSFSWYEEPYYIYCSKDQDVYYVSIGSESYMDE